MRTADAIGASEIVFGGYTPGPEDRFGRARLAFTKASLGAERNVPWRTAARCTDALREYKNRGAFVVAVEQAAGATDYKRFKPPPGDTVVILGNEVAGLPRSILRLADAVTQIPMRGKKESLNVSVAAGVVLYRWFDNAKRKT